MEFRPGFRMRGLDGMILLLGAVGTLLSMDFSPRLGFIIGFVGIHFFLFCNVFRITRRAELIWAGFFIALTALSTLWDLISWDWAVGMALSGTLLILWVEIRRPSYHGIFWQRFNPDLPAWWVNYLSEQSRMDKNRSSEPAGSRCG